MPGDSTDADSFFIPTWRHFETRQNRQLELCVGSMRSQLSVDGCRDQADTKWVVIEGVAKES
jgi:hypothetical protein